MDDCEGARVKGCKGARGQGVQGGKSAKVQGCKFNVAKSSFFTVNIDSDTFIIRVIQNGHYKKTVMSRVNAAVLRVTDSTKEK